MMRLLLCIYLFYVEQIFFECHRNIVCIVCEVFIDNDKNELKKKSRKYLNNYNVFV